METKNNNATQPVKKNGNAEGLKKAATIGGVGAVSAAAGVMGASIANAAGNDEEEIVFTPEQTDEQNPEAEAAATEEQANTQQAQHQPANSGHSTPAQPASQEPAPMDHSEQPAEGPADSDGGSEPEPLPEPEPETGLPNVDNVDPEVIAADIVNAEFVDPADIDAPNLPVASTGVIELPDGEQLAAASIVDGDEQMFLVDLNNDGQYDVAMDDQGNVPVDEMGAPLAVPGTLTTSDAQSLAQINNEEEAEYEGLDPSDPAEDMGEIPTDDIIDLA